MDYTRLPDNPGFSARSNLDTELQAASDLVSDCGYTLPDDITNSAILGGVGRAFIRDQLPPAHMLLDLSPASRHYFGTILQPGLEKGIRGGDNRVFALAHQIGRVIGAGATEQRLYTPHPPLGVSKNAVEVENHSIPISMDVGHIVEFGMGINGFFTHRQNLQNGAYSITAIHRNKGEVAVLQGISDFFGLGSDRINIVDRGLAHRTQELLKQKGPGTTDVVIASRVHAAGNELRVGINNAERLLHLGGILIARGPREFKAGMGYDRVAAMVIKSVNLHIEADLKFDELVGGGHIDKSRLIVARKK